MGGIMASEAANLNLKVEARPKLGIIDCDVHPFPIDGAASIMRYLPKPWQERFLRKGSFLTNAGAPTRYTNPNGTVVRADARSPAGKIAGSDPHYLIADLIEGNGIDAALLNCLDSAKLCTTQAGPDESIVLAQAYNEHFVQEWLPLSRHLAYAMMVPSQDPLAAAAEIRRIGSHPQIAAVHLPLLSALMGNRYYWPIYEAAQEADLPLFVHVTGLENIAHGASAVTNGSFESYVERYSAVAVLGELSVNSLIWSGTFERFPKLRVIFAEFGFLWMLPLLMRLDRAWRGLRHEVPWVRRTPTETAMSHCFFTTQPIEEPNDPRDLERLIGMLGYDNLCFSSDYPHWDNDMPGATLQSLPEEARRKVFRDNALKALRRPAGIRA
jgi:predicted TIM-barrel fold metal-dependent hydrolase